MEQNSNNSNSNNHHNHHYYDSATSSSSSSSVTVVAVVVPPPASERSPLLPVPPPRPTPQSSSSSSQSPHTTNKKVKRFDIHDDSDVILIRPRKIIQAICVLLFVLVVGTMTGIAIHRAQRRYSHIVVHDRRHHTGTSSSSSSSSSTGSSSYTRGYTNNNRHHPIPNTRSNNYDNDDDIDTPVVTIAMIGNSMQYFNDFPRYLETISRGRVRQNSCLHGGASISSILMDGNAMYPQFGTPNALIGYETTRAADTTTTTTTRRKQPIYDYGACTVPQLLLGLDDRLHDPGYAISNDEMNNTNPCRVLPSYLHYAISSFEHHGIRNSTIDRTIGFVDEHTTKSNLVKPTYPSHWDYVLINDNTMNPARGPTRDRALATLQRFYVPWLQQTGATPIFLWTHAYTPKEPIVSTDTTTTSTNTITPPRDMAGLTDIGNFTSLTRVGYQAYMDLLELNLPNEQQPKLAPVGLAFLAVYDDDIDIWKLLFHSDGIHASPSGTFLQGCIVYYTIFNTMPDYQYIIRHDMSSLWNTARMMQHYWEPPNPYPTIQHAKYLYSMAEKIMVDQYIPPSYIHYTNNEVADTGNKTAVVPLIVK